MCATETKTPLNKGLTGAAFVRDVINSYQLWLRDLFIADCKLIFSTRSNFARGIVLRFGTQKWHDLSKCGRWSSACLLVANRSYRHLLFALRSQLHPNGKKRKSWPADLRGCCSFGGKRGGCSEDGRRHAVLDSSGNPDPASLVQKVTFRVEEYFEGISAEMVDVYGSGTTLDYHFAAGNRYLVYGWLGKDRKIRTGKCTRTAPSSDAKEDLKFLRSLKNRRGLK